MEPLLTLHIFPKTSHSLFLLTDLKSISPATTSTNDVPKSAGYTGKFKDKSQKVPFKSYASMTNELSKLLNFGPFPPIIQIYSSGFSIYSCGRFIPALRVQGRADSVISSGTCQLYHCCFVQSDNADSGLTSTNWDPLGSNL